MIFITYLIFLGYDKVSDTFTLHSHWKNIPDRFVTDSKKFWKKNHKTNFRCIFFWSKFFLVQIGFDHFFTQTFSIYDESQECLQYDFAQFCFNLSWNYQESFAIRFCLKFFESVVNPSALFSIQFYPKFLNLSGIFCNKILPTFFESVMNPSEIFFNMILPIIFWICHEAIRNVLQ